MSKVPKAYKNKLSKYAERLGKSVAELEKELLVVYKQLTAVVKTSESNLWRMSYSRWYGAYRRDTGNIFSPAPTWTGLVAGDSGLIDFIEVMRRGALYRYNHPDPQVREKAIANLVVSRDGTPLDTREKINYGRDDNPNYGRSIPEDEHSYYRALYGVASKGTEFDPSNTQFFRLNINGENAVNVSYPIRSPVQFRANPRKRSKYSFLDMNAISKKEVTMMPVDVEVPNIIECLEATAWQPYRIEDIKMLYGMYKGDRSVPVLIFANVATIGTDVNDKTGNRTLWVDDSDDAEFDAPGVALFLNGEIPIEFGLDSKVLFVCRVELIGEEGDEDSRFVISAHGYYAPPDFLLPPI